MALLRSLVLLGLLFSISKAQLIPNLNPKSIDFNLFGIKVELYCTPDGNKGIFGLAAPPFKGANVELQCGNSDLISNVTTDSFGIGYLVTKLAPVRDFVPIENNCKLTVNTTLTTCNPALLAGGVIASGLKFIGTSLLNKNKTKVANFAPTGFHFLPM